MLQPDVASGPTSEYKTRNKTETFNPHQLPQKKHFSHNNPKLQGIGGAQTKTKSLLETRTSEHQNQQTMGPNQEVYTKQNPPVLNQTL